MTLLDLVSAEAGAERRRIVGAAIIAGFANVLILVTLNILIHAPEGRDLRSLYLLALFIATYLLASRYTTNRTTALIETALYRVRMRVGQRIVQAELDTLERIRAAEICDQVTQNTVLITDRAGAFATMMQSLVILTFVALYLAWLSLPAFALLVLLAVAGILLLHGVRKDIVAAMLHSGKLRVTFAERFTDLLLGFKETQFSRQRARDIREDIAQASSALRAANIRFTNFLSDGVVVGDAVLFVLLGTAVYTVHARMPVNAWTLTHLVAAVMFSWGPLMVVASSIMPYLRSNAALDELAELEQRLAVTTAMGASDPESPSPWQGRLGPIELHGIEYGYPAESGGEPFTIGPLDLTIHPGETLFIVGGNGSGKSTLLKVLTGLYPPQAGSLQVGGVPIDRGNLATYRDCITAIFSDFYLFKKLYGLPDATDRMVQELLARMRLTGKTAYKNRCFSKLTLSTGQRKRLAMVVALLEDRPICVFDEWAADQDPEFRAYFYHQLLPELKAKGKTLVVVSHDDRYFHLADRVAIMELGMLRSITAPEQASVSA